MNNLTNVLVTLWTDEEGLTTVEYAIAGALISVAIATAFKDLGTQVAAVLANIVTIISAGA